MMGQPFNKSCAKKTFCEEKLHFRHILIIS